MSVQDGLNEWWIEEDECPKEMDKRVYSLYTIEHAANDGPDGCWIKAAVCDNVWYPGIRDTRQGVDFGGQEKEA